MLDHQAASTPRFFYTFPAQTWVESISARVSASWLRATASCCSSWSREDSAAASFSSTSLSLAKGGGSDGQGREEPGEKGENAGCHFPSNVPAISSHRRHRTRGPSSPGSELLLLLLGQQHKLALGIS